MSSDFRVERVRDLLTNGVLWVEDGNHGENRPLSDEFAQEGTPFVRPDDLKYGVVDFANCDRINDSALQRIRKGKGRAGDIAFTHRATVGRMARLGASTPDFVANPGVTLWRVLNRMTLDPDYLYYFMQTPFFMNQVWAEAGNTDTFPYISLTQQRGLRIRYPSLAVQRSIGSALSSIDDRIALLRETNATLEAIAQALFRSWFVDFDPVRAKSQGLAPAGMDEATAGLFPEGFEESALGSVPAGWQAGTVSHFAALQKGAVAPSERSDTVFEHYSLPAFDSGQLPVREQGAEIKSNKTPVPSNAVLLSKLNPHIPRIWLPFEAGPNAVCSTEFLVFMPTTEATKEFVYCTFSAPQFQERLRQLVTGTSSSHQRVKPDGVLALRAVSPPGPLVDAFTLFIQPMLERVGRNRLEAQTLADLRDALLPRLISGQLRLPEAEALAGGSAPGRTAALHAAST